MSCKIQTVHEIVLGPVGLFESVTKGIQHLQRALDAQTRKNAGKNVTLVRITILYSFNSLQ